MIRRLILTLFAALLLAATTRGEEPTRSQKLDAILQALEHKAQPAQWGGAPGNGRCPPGGCPAPQAPRQPQQPGNEQYTARPPAAGTIEMAVGVVHNEIGPQQTFLSLEMAPGIEAPLAKYAGGPSGSGTAIGYDPVTGETLVLTCSHLYWQNMQTRQGDRLGTLTVKFPGQVALVGTRIANDIRNDCSLIVVKSATPPLWLHVATTAPAPGAPLWKVGYPAGHFDVGQGAVIDVGAQLRTTARLRGGDSGGLFANAATNEVIGVSCESVSSGGRYWSAGPSFQSINALVVQSCWPLRSKPPAPAPIPAPSPIAPPAPVPSPIVIPPPIPGQNGRDGRDGVDGKNGNDGKPGAIGAPGAPGTNGVNGTNGKDADMAVIAALQAQVAALKQSISASGAAQVDIGPLTARVAALEALISRLSGEKIVPLP